MRAWRDMFGGGGGPAVITFWPQLWMFTLSPYVENDSLLCSVSELPAPTIIEPESPCTD